MNLCPKKNYISFSSSNDSHSFSQKELNYNGSQNPMSEKNDTSARQNYPLSEYMFIVVVLVIVGTIVVVVCAYRPIVPFSNKHLLNNC